MLAAGVVLALAVAARADLTTPTRVGGTHGVCAPVRLLAPGDGAERLVRNLLGGLAQWSDDALPVSESGANAVRDTDAAGRELTLPPGPSSASLFLWAASGFGAWHLGRSARKVHLGAFPEWYHTGGPAQIGHATPLDLEFSLAALPLCPFEAPIPLSGRGSTLWWRWYEPQPRLHSQYIPSVVDPRGPPRHS